MPKHETTKKEFELFVTECKKWIDFFGLIDWKVKYEHCVLASSNYADLCVEGLEQRFAVIRLNKKCSPIDREFFDVKLHAFHEVMELLLYPLSYIGQCRYVLDPCEFGVAVHSIIRTLENTIYKKLKN
jgi:hypothetical protein